MLVSTPGPRAGQIVRSSAPSYLPWTNGLVITADRGAKARLFCFPCAGAGASWFRDWRKALPQEIEPIAVQLPGRESRWSERPFERLPALIDALVSGLGPAFDRPFALFGHSTGGLLGFELARRLSEAGKIPLHLFVAATRAPQDHDPNPPLHRLPDAELIERLRGMNGIPRPVLQSPDLLRVVLPAIRADLALSETYEFEEGEALDCPILACGGWDDPEVPPSSLAGWRRQTRKGFSARLFPGDHFFPNTARDALLRQIGRVLSRYVSPRESAR